MPVTWASHVAAHEPKEAALEPIIQIGFDAFFGPGFHLRQQH